MNKIKILIGILLLMGGLHTEAFAQSDIRELYVSHSGSDKFPGTLAKPFKTLDRAKSEVIALKENHPSEIKVYIREGEYFLNETFRFYAIDGGDENTKVTYSGYKDEVAMLHSGVAINQWKEESDGIWSAPAKGLKFRQLYINGARATRARHPDLGSFFHVYRWDDHEKTIKVPAAHIPGTIGVRAEIILQQNWGESILRISSIEISSDTAIIHPVAEERDLVFSRPYPRRKAGQAYHLENSRAFLNNPGEWWLDEANDRVYYIPQKEEESKAIHAIVPTLETLMAISGTLEQPVTNLTFENLVFAYSTFLRPSLHGHLNAQAGQINIKATPENDQYVIRPPAGVYLAAAKNVVFNRCVFKNMGATALDFHFGTYQCKARGNLIHDIAGNGIMVGKFVQDSLTEYHEAYLPEDLREVCHEDEITDNYVLHTGRDFYGSAAIAAGYPQNIKITHNTIRDNPYSGISIGFGWTSAPNAMSNNVISNNDISDVVNVMDDGAGIYTLSLQPGTKITGNFIYGIKRAPWAGTSPVAGIYCDEASGGTLEKPLLVENNVVLMNRGDKHLFLHQPGYVLVNGLFYNVNIPKAKEISEKVGVRKEFKRIEIERKFP